MGYSRTARPALALAACAILVVTLAGCGLFSRSKAAPEMSQPASAPAAPVPAPPTPPRREAGVRIAEEESLKGLIQGKTTRADVRERFGLPQEVVLSPGLETFIYYRDKTSGWFSRTTERVEMLTIRFDPNGVLKDFEYRYSGR